MGITIKSILKNLDRPLPELYIYLTDKAISKIWCLYLKEVGEGFYVSRGARIRGGKNIRLGKNFQTGRNLWLDAVSQHIDFKYLPEIQIGSNVSASDNLHIAAASSVIIGDGVLIGSNVHITDHSHGQYRGTNQDTPEGMPINRSLFTEGNVIIGNNVWIGDGVVILPNTIIGSGSIIGANSVVSKSVPENVIAVGAPAKAIKVFDYNCKCWVKIT